MDDPDHVQVFNGNTKSVEVGPPGRGMIRVPIPAKTMISLHKNIIAGYIPAPGVVILEEEPQAQEAEEPIVPTQVVPDSAQVGALAPEDGGHAQEPPVVSASVEAHQEPKRGPGRPKKSK